MKKYLLVLLLIAFMVPSVALASWWNPFSWSIWNIFKSKPDIQQEQLENPTPTPIEKTSETPVNNMKTEQQNTLSCNGKTWSKCDAGYKFICPAGGGDASCDLIQKPQTQTNILGQTPSPQPLPTPPLTTTQEDTSLLISVKDKAIETDNAIISGYSELDAFLQNDLSSMNNILSSLTGQNSEIAQIVIDLTKERIKDVKEMRNDISQVIGIARANRDYLQSQQLNFFLNYQIPSDTYDALNSLKQLQQLTVGYYNSYNTALKQATISTTTSRYTYCNFQNRGTYGSITCY